MRSLLLAAALIAFMAWGCASVHSANRGLMEVDSETFWSLWPADSTETVEP